MEILKGSPFGILKEDSLGASLRGISFGCGLREHPLGILKGDPLWDSLRGGSLRQSLGDFVLDVLKGVPFPVDSKIWALDIALDMPRKWFANDEGLLSKGSQLWRAVVPCSHRSKVLRVCRAAVGLMVVIASHSIPHCRPLNSQLVWKGMSECGCR